MRGFFIRNLTFFEQFYFVASFLLQYKIFLVLLQVHIYYGLEEYKGWMEQRADPHTDRRTDRWTERRTEQRTLWIVENLSIPTKKGQRITKNAKKIAQVGTSIQNIIINIISI